ncbi:MAG: phosphomannomutase/phosphoglucomutase, partial [Myxococcales bacterium]|nr:phosphomannomutase/phosphoglucomutase [Myxococcales bacterium]
MQTPAHVFREYDIRGRADRDLSDALVTAIGRALATFYGGTTPTRGFAGRVAVGRDCRASSDRLFAALTAGLRASGAEVIDIGVGPTPLLYFAAHHLGTDGAVMITGSHNPPEDNGFKMMKGRATLFGEDIQTLLAIITEERFTSAEGPPLTIRSVEDDYVAAVAAATRRELLPAGKVVIDAGNGAAGPLAIRTLTALGVDVDPLYCEMDGTFPNHHPDPTVEENLQALRARVAATGAALGVAYDGDGDRIGVIDDRGEVIWGDKLMVLYARAVLAERPGAAIIGEVKCSETLYADIRAKGGRAIVNKTGHSLIKKRMKEEGALLAGEMSGH